MRRATWKLGFVVLVTALVASGCARVGSSAGAQEAVDATSEMQFMTDGKWVAFASGSSLSPAARSDVQIRWARPNYGTSSWKRAVVSGGGEDTAGVSGAHWIWYPQEGFEFGADNSLPDNRRVVHFRREFYNKLLNADLKDPYVEVVASGKISFQVYLNGYVLDQDDEAIYGSTPFERRQTMRNRQQQQGQAGYEMMDRQLKRFSLRDRLVVGKNVIAIEATAHVNNDVGGRPMQNHVRSGIAAKVEIQ